MKSAIVTGASSFIGRNLVRVLADRGYGVCAVVRTGSLKSTGQEHRKNVRRVECLMENIRTLKDSISGADIFFHLAWNGTRGKERSDGELQRKNYLLSMDALETAIESGCKVFVGAGSQAEYGLRYERTYEDSQADPDTAYGRYKLLFTQDGAALAKERGIRFIMPRFFSLYGKDDYEKTILQSLVTSFLKDEDCPTTLCGQLWNFMYVEDAVNGMLWLAEGGFEGIYNFASEDTRPLRSFVEEVAAAVGGRGRPLFGAIPYPAGGAVSLDPDISKLLATGFRPEYDFARGIAEVIEREREKTEIKS